MKSVVAVFGLTLAAATASIALAAPVVVDTKPPVRLAQAAPAAAAAQTDPYGLPILEGYEMTVAKCSECHDTSTFSGARHSKEEWGDIIASMIGRGANISDAEFDQIEAYLTAAFGS